MAEQEKVRSEEQFESCLTYLERITIPILWHLTNNAATVAELAHLAATPCVQTAFFISVLAVVLEEKFEVHFSGCRPTT